MDRGLLIAGVGVVGTLGTIVALVALLTAGGAQAAFSASEAPAPPRVARNVRVAKAPVAPVPQPPRAHGGRIRTDGTREAVVAAAPHKSATVARSAPAGRLKASDPLDDSDLWASPEASAATVPAVAVADNAPPVDPDEDMSDFELVLGPRGGGDDTGRGR